MKTEQYGVVTSIKNESGAAIAKGHFVSVLGTMFVSSEDHNPKLGVCLANTDDNEMMPVAVTGIVLCVTGAAVSKSSHVYCDTGVVHPVVFSDPPTTAQLEQVVGIALDAATGAGETIRVLLT